jgi:hypothetical protein
MKARTALVSLAAGALVLGSASISSAAPEASVSASVASSHQIKASLITSTPALAACFPHAKAKVTVDLTTAAKGKDTFTISASGLKPKTDFTVFLLQKAGAPFGAAEYIGDFTTDRHGDATNNYKLIVEEAFAFNNETQARTDLNSVGFWFADQKDDDGCLGPNSPVTGFDGDGQAGVQMMNSGIAVLP